MYAFLSILSLALPKSTKLDCLVTAQLHHVQFLLSWEYLVVNTRLGKLQTVYMYAISSRIRIVPYTYPSRQDPSSSLVAVP